jgi:UDP:flavonoid glycosyltransferase YjiC (YdhE family)
MEVLHNPSYRQNARAIQSEFARHDSPSEAAQLMERLAQTKRAVTRAH